MLSILGCTTQYIQSKLTGFIVLRSHQTLIDLQSCSNEIEYLGTTAGQEAEKKLKVKVGG